MKFQQTVCPRCSHRFAAEVLDAAAPAVSPSPELLEQIGRIMHDSWSKTKRAQGFHGPNDECDKETYSGGGTFKLCNAIDSYRCSAAEPQKEE